MDHIFNPDVANCLRYGNVAGLAPEADRVPGPKPCRLGLRVRLPDVYRRVKLS
jgi:hypothetical protein